MVTKTISSAKETTRKLGMNLLESCFFNKTTCLVNIQCLTLAHTSATHLV